MKAMFTGFAAIIVISLAAGYGLPRYAGWSSAEALSGPAVRLD